MEILKQIQVDLIDEKTQVSNILRKAMILASQLKSQELREWVDKELNGYTPNDEIPDYRKISTLCVGTWTNGYWRATNHQVPMWNITDEKLKNYITTFIVHNGIRTIEERAADETLNYFLPADVTAAVNTYVGEQGYVYSEIKYTIRAQNFKQILDIVKNRLLDFVLKLDENWTIQDKLPSKEEISNLISVVIHNSPQGGNMTVFDQRGQSVNYQYNAAGNININSIKDKDGLVIQLEHLLNELRIAKEAKAINSDIATESEYHLLQAAKEAKKEKPEQKSFLSHVNQAKNLLQDVAAVATIVEAIIKITEIAKQFI